MRRRLHVSGCFLCYTFRPGCQAQLVGDIDACEIFAGAGALTHALRSQGFVVAAADIEMGQCFDITSCAGFLHLDEEPVQISVVVVSIKSITRSSLLFVCFYLFGGLRSFRACLLIVRRVRRKGLSFFAPKCDFSADWLDIHLVLLSEFQTRTTQLLLDPAFSFCHNSKRVLPKGCGC